MLVWRALITRFVVPRLSLALAHDLTYTSPCPHGRNARYQLGHKGLINALGDYSCWNFSCSCSRVMCWLLLISCDCTAFCVCWYRRALIIRFVVGVPVSCNCVVITIGVCCNVHSPHRAIYRCALRFLPFALLESIEELLYLCIPLLNVRHFGHYHPDQHDAACYVPRENAVMQP